jgi:hypothetical protein
MKIETENLPIERVADSRGRVRLGTEWAGKRVRVVVIEEVDPPD